MADPLDDLASQPGARMCNFGTRLDFAYRPPRHVRAVRGSPMGVLDGPRAENDFFVLWVSSDHVAHEPRPSYQVGTVELFFTLKLSDYLYLSRPEPKSKTVYVPILGRGLTLSRAGLDNGVKLEKLETASVNQIYIEITEGGHSLVIGNSVPPVYALSPCAIVSLPIAVADRVRRPGVASCGRAPHATHRSCRTSVIKRGGGDPRRVTARHQ
jgi:hypothetical protein